jgi:pilus assembly protein CpaB
VNPRQRRGLLFLAAAGVGAVAVFVWVTAYVSDVRSQVGPPVGVLVLSEAIPAFSPVAETSTTLREIPERWAPAHALRDPVQLVGTVAATDLPAGAMLQEGMLIPEPSIEPGQREVAILVDAETGVAGKIQPGSIVDVFATYELREGTARCAVVLVPGVRVVDVGRPATRQTLNETGVPTQEQSVAVTMTLTPTDALKVVQAESYATEVRLGLFRAGEGGTEPPPAYCGPIPPRAGRQ